jgi:hypothetical protein
MNTSLNALITLLSCSSLISGCALNTDVLPSFDGPFAYGSVTKYVNIIDVEHQVQCEIRDFLTDYNTKYRFNNIDVTSANIANNLLAFDQPATVTLTVQTDLTGKATATGINLNKLGLQAIANEISLSNKVPSLQANLSAKGTVIASPVVVFPQTDRDVWQFYTGGESLAKLTTLAFDNSLSEELMKIEYGVKVNENNLSKEEKIKAQANFNKDFSRDVLGYKSKYYHDYSKNDRGPDVYPSSYALPENPLKALTPPAGVLPNSLNYPTRPIIMGLHNINCQDVEAMPNNLSSYMRHLYIKDWLFEFFTRNMGVQVDASGNANAEDKLNPHDYFLRRVGSGTYVDSFGEPRALTTVGCALKLTLKTAIAITFDVSAGINPILSPTYIIPISGFTGEISPAWTQTLQIDFTLQNSQNNNLCVKSWAQKPLGSS